MVTISVVPYIEYNRSTININDVKITTTRGSGAGGQHKNKVETCVIVEYDGIRVRCDSERSQYKNKQIALNILSSKINNIKSKKETQDIQNIKKTHHGTGNRSEKIKTYSEKRNEVINHRNNKRQKLSNWKKGK